MIQQLLHTLGQLLRIWANLSEEFNYPSDILLGPRKRLRFHDSYTKEVVIHVALHKPRHVEAPMDVERLFTGRQSFFDLVFTG